MIGSAFRILFKVLGYAFLGLIAVIVLFSGCVWYVYNYVPWEDKKIERAFHNRLEEKVSAGEDKVYLRDLVDFEWDRACYISASNDGDLSEKITLITLKTGEFYIPLTCVIDGCDTLLFLSKSHHLVNLSPKSFSVLCPEQKHVNVSSLRCCSPKSFIKPIPRESGETRFIISEDKEH